MIRLEEVRNLHQQLIKRYGGADGIRDQNALQSAINRPFASFDGNELYPQPLQKAACLIESFLVNHPFIDGNKRTGYVVMRLFLQQQGWDIHATMDEKYDFVINIAAGKIKFEAIVEWLTLHARRNF